MSISHKHFPLLKDMKLVFQIKTAVRGCLCVFVMRVFFRWGLKIDRESIKWKKTRRLMLLRGGCAERLGWNWGTQKSLGRLPAQLCLHECLLHLQFSEQFQPRVRSDIYWKWFIKAFRNGLYLSCNSSIFSFSMFANVEVFIWNLAYWAHLQPQNATEKQQEPERLKPHIRKLV